MTAPLTSVLRARGRTRAPLCADAPGYMRGAGKSRKSPSVAIAVTLAPAPAATAVRLSPSGPLQRGLSLALAVDLFIVPYHPGRDSLAFFGARRHTKVASPRSAGGSSPRPSSSGPGAANGGERPASPCTTCRGGAPRSALCGCHWVIPMDPLPPRAYGECRRPPPLPPHRESGRGPGLALHLMRYTYLIPRRPAPAAGGPRAALGNPGRKPTFRAGKALAGGPRGPAGEKPCQSWPIDATKTFRAALRPPRSLGGLGGRGGAPQRR